MSALDPRAETIWAALKDVHDPELPISIVDMGLIYDVRVAGGVVELDVTFTAAGCPCMDFILMDIKENVLRIPTIDDVEINIVWDPPWTKDRLSADGRELLRSFGVST